MTNPRQAVYDALSAMPDPMWLLILSVIKPVNVFVAETVADDPTPCARLNDAIEAEYERLGKNPC